MRKKDYLINGLIISNPSIHLKSSVLAVTRGRLRTMAVPAIMESPREILRIWRREIAFSIIVSSISKIDMDNDIAIK